MTELRAWGLLACLAVLPGASAHAAPAESGPGDSSEAPAADACEAISPRNCMLDRARELYREADALAEQGELEAALELWEKSYILQPSDALRSRIAEAHLDAYAANPGPDNRNHLLHASAMIGENLAGLDERKAALERERAELQVGGDDPEATRELDSNLESLASVRAKTQDQLDDIDRQLAALDAALQAEIAERATAEIEAETRRKLAQERQVFESRLRKQRRIYLGTGGTLLGVGAALLGVMAANLAVGEAHDATNRDYFEDPTTTPLEYALLEIKGQRANQAAWATGAIGSAMMISGTALMFVGGLRYSSGRASLRDGPELSLGPGGLRLRF